MLSAGRPASLISKQANMSFAKAGPLLHASLIGVTVINNEESMLKARGTGVMHVCTIKMQ